MSGALVIVLNCEGTPYRMLEQIKVALVTNTTELLYQPQLLCLYLLHTGEKESSYFLCHYYLGFFSYMQIKKVSIYTNPKIKCYSEQGSEWRKSEYFHCWAAKKSEQAWGLWREFANEMGRDEGGSVGQEGSMGTGQGMGWGVLESLQPGFKPHQLLHCSKSQFPHL